MSNISLITSLADNNIVVVEEFGHHSGDLHSVEQQWVTNASYKRRAEFASGRKQARSALERLGCPREFIAVNPDRSPAWPTGTVGSITHCDGFCGAAVAWSAIHPSIGIDAEMNEPIDPDLVKIIATLPEINMISKLPPDCVHWFRLIFCAKESFFKAWYPLTHIWIDFDDVIITIDPRDQTFRVSMCDERPQGLNLNVRGILGRYNVSNGYIGTLVTIS